MDVREVSAPDTLPLERLEAEITEWASHLAAAECRWIQLIAEYDRREGWAHWGCHSIVQWLGWHCGLGGRAARERLRVRHALRELPQITEAFAIGQLSYSKVRAITRVATPMNEGDLVTLANHATASQVDRIVSAYRGVLTVEEEIERANRQVAGQYLRTDWEDDGSMVIHARVPTEIGASLLKALVAARDQLPADASGEGGPAGPVHRLPSATNVDALHLMTETFLARGAASRDGSDRYLMMLNVDEDVLVHDDPTGMCELDGGPSLAPETGPARSRAACGACCTRAIRDVDSLDAGVDALSTRTTSDTVRAGGSNELDNLVELCWFHHRLVHEGGWMLRFDSHGNVIVTNPTGNVIPARTLHTGRARAVIDRNTTAGLTVNATTITPRWYGDPLDLDHVTTALWCADQRRPDQN